MKILLIHGWLMNTDCFEPIVRMLELHDNEVHTVRFHGLDNGARHVDLKTISHQLRVKLHNDKFDLIIAHSMGARILLDNLDLVGDAGLILYSPMVGNLTLKAKALCALTPLLPLIKLLPLSTATLHHAYSSLLGDECAANAYVTSGFFTCNGRSAARLLRQALLLHNDTDCPITNKVLVVHGDRDPLIQCNYVDVADIIGHGFEIKHVPTGHLSYLFARLHFEEFAQ